MNKKIILWVDVETLIFPWCHRSRLSLTFFSLFPQTVWWVKASFWTSQKSNGSRPRTTNASPTTEWLHPINTKSKLLSTVSICGERERECEWERPHLITLKIIYNPSVHIIYVFHSIKKQCFFRHSCICSEYNSVGRGTGPQQMDLDWSRSWLVTALLLLLLLLYCCQILQWSQTWRICLHTWVRPPSSAVKLWLFLQLPLSGTEMSTGEHQFQILLYLKTEMIVEGRCSFSKMF